jgi:uncharacterized protein
MIPTPAFAPFEALAETLLPHALPQVAAGVPDGVHDAAHLLRVWHNAFAIAALEGGDTTIVAAAVLLHDCVAVEKNAPDRARASALAADQAATILTGLGWQPPQIEAVHHAIEAHSFSAGIAPTTLEARILQDADRLDAIGAIGVARCFYTAGRMGSKLYDVADPRAEHRALDDAAFAIDHFRTKLLRLNQGFQTESGKSMADERKRRIAEFLILFETEIGAFGDES